MRENFESPETSWRVAAADASYRLRWHQRVKNESHWGHGSEQFRFAAGPGTHLYIEHDIDHPRVIDELRVGVWVKAGQPGIRFYGRAVFPRTTGDDGKPVTALIAGSSYKNAGAWEQLILTDIPNLVQQQARVLRLQLGRDVDIREAYLDRVLLNVYTTPGEADVLIDDLEIEGHVPVRDQTPIGSEGGVVPAQFAEEAPEASIDLRGAVLLVDGQPIFPRAIEHRGESFEFLKRLGFNAVKLAAPPTPWQLAEAERQQIWIIAPPPDVQSGRSINSSHRRVLCWHLGAQLDARQVAQTRDLAFAVRRADEQPGRPLLAEAHEQMRTYSRIANVMMLSREPLGTSFELDELSNWCEARRQLLRPGTPTWATVQTEPLATLQQQLQLQGLDAPSVDAQQIRMVAMSVVAGGARGLIFTSRRRLDGDDEQSLHRAQAIELVNRELDLIEPWLAVCGHAAPVAVGEDGVKATMFSTQHSQLILLTQVAPMSQYVMSPPAVRRLPLVVPGVAESSDAYFISPTGLEPLNHRRVTGGIGVAIEELDWVSTILFTSDPRAFARLSQTLARNQQRTAQLQLASAIEGLRQSRSLTPATHEGQPVGEIARSLNLVEANLAQGQRMLASDARTASIYAQRALYSLAELRSGAWQRGIPQGRTITSPVEFAASASARQKEFGQGESRSENHILGGNMESLPKLVQSGWRNFRREQPGVSSVVELSPVAPNTGQFALRLQATRGGEQSTAQMESPPVWIRSPDVAVRLGQAYVIQGWVRVDASPAGSLDGVMIYDTHHGRDLALRVSRTSGWQPFRIQGVALADRPLSVNIELTGAGEAFVDDVELLLPSVSEAPLVDEKPTRPNSTAERLRNLIRLPR